MVLAHQNAIYICRFIKKIDKYMNKIRLPMSVYRLTRLLVKYFLFSCKQIKGEFYEYRTLISLVIFRNFCFIDTALTGVQARFQKMEEFLVQDGCMYRDSFRVHIGIYYFSCMARLSAQFGPHGCVCKYFTRHDHQSKRYNCRMVYYSEYMVSYATIFIKIIGILDFLFNKTPTLGVGVFINIHEHDLSCLRPIFMVMRSNNQL